MLRTSRLIILYYMIHCSVIQCNSESSDDYYYTPDQDYTPSYKPKAKSMCRSDNGCDTENDQLEKVEECFSTMPDPVYLRNLFNESYFSPFLKESLIFYITEDIKNQHTKNKERIEACSSTLNFLNDQMRKLNENTRNFLEKIEKLREPVDCIIGRDEFNIQLSKIYDCTKYTYKCCECLNGYWEKINELYSPDKGCNLKDSLKVMIIVDEHFNGKNRDVSPERLDFLYTLTKHHNVLTSLDTNISSYSDCTYSSEAICFEPTESQINVLTNQMKTHFKHGPAFKNIELLSSFIDLQNDLVLINQDLAEKSVGGTNKVAQVTESMLSAYIGLVNVAIGNQSAVWSEVKGSNKKSELEQILLKNEKYIGHVTDSLLNSNDSNEDFNEEALAVKMLKVKNPNGSVNFNFQNSEIWLMKPESKTTLKVHAIYYKTWKTNLQQFSSINNSKIFGSKTLIGEGGIISLSTRANHKNISVPVMYKINFSDDDKNTSWFAESETISNHRCLVCQYLDPITGLWNGSGCKIESADSVGVTCKCNHTTNFAAFMSPLSETYSATASQDFLLEVMEYIGSSLSIIGLVLTLVIFYIVRCIVRNDRMKAHLNLSVALLLLHCLQLGADFAVNNNLACEIFTITTHYFILATFMWMLVEGIFLYLYVVQVFIHSRMDTNKWMYLTGWGLPIVMVAVSSAFGLYNNTYIQKMEYCDDNQVLYPPLTKYERKYAYCWLDAKSGMTWSFVGPALIIIFFNFLILIKVIQVLLSMSKKQNEINAFHSNSKIENKNKDEKNKKQPTDIGLRPPASSNMYFRSPVNSEDLSPDEPSNHQRPSIPANIVHSRSSPQSNSQNNLLNPSPTNNRSFLIKDVRTATKGAVVLLPILGIPWIIGIFGSGSFVMRVIFVLFNSIQGITIFLVYCIFNGEVMYSLVVVSFQFF